ncbi:MAG: SIS domain-containing protein [Nitrospinota bacterium]
MNVLERARQILEIEKNALADLAASLDENFVKAIDLILDTEGRVVITGMGKSGLIGRKISATLSSVGTPSFFIHPVEAIHGDLGMLAGGDLVIAISKSGEGDIARLIPTIKRHGLKLIALTGNPSSTLGKVADVVINAAVKMEACSWDVVPTASTTAVLAVGDAIALVVMEKKGFQVEDFAVHHPGGSLGRGMLVTVKELMHTGNGLPLVNETASMSEVLKEMSSKKLGITLVTKADGTLAGIITDGDLRRLMEKESSPMAKKAAEVMSGPPQTIEEDAMGGTAVKLMEDKKITSLVIVANGGKPHGVVHLHDLLRAGAV